MSSRIDEQFRAVLAAIDDVAPSPPPFPARPVATGQRHRGLAAAAIAFAGVLLLVGVVALALRPVQDQAGTTPLLHHYVIELPGWQVASAEDNGSSTTATFWNAATSTNAIVIVSSDGQNDPPGTAYESALASLSEDEHIGSANVLESSAEAFRLADSSGFEFVWPDTNTSSVQVVVLADSYIEAERVLSGISRIDEDSWSEITSRTPPVEASTTTTEPTRGAP